MTPRERWLPTPWTDYQAQAEAKMREIVKRHTPRGDLPGSNVKHLVVGWWQTEHAALTASKKGRGSEWLGQAAALADALATVLAELDEQGADIDLRDAP